MILDKILKYLGIEKKAEGRTFFDYSSREKKKILKHAVEEGAKIQLDLIREYEKRYSQN